MKEPLENDLLDISFEIWNINEAIKVCQLLEPIAIIHGFHVALGGSVLVSGKSEKDINIFIYQHSKLGSERPIRKKMEPFLMSLTEIGFKVREDVKKAKTSETGDPYYKQVESVEYQNKRIDLIFILP